MSDTDRRLFFRRSHPAVRACLRYLGVPALRLDDATLEVYRVAAEEGLKVMRVLPAVAARHAVPGPGEVERVAAPASHVLREFVDGLGERERRVFVLAELGGVPEPSLARAQSIAPARLAAGLARLRARFARFAAAQGVAPRPVLAAAVQAERLAPADESRLWYALVDTLAPAPVRPAAIDVWTWIAAIAPALLAAAWLLGRPAAHHPSALAALRPALHDRVAEALRRARPPLAPALAPAPEPEPEPELPPEPAPEPDPAPPPTIVASQTKTKNPRPARPRRPAELDERERLAKERDPGRVIFELEILKAAKGALDRSPRQALAYADQHAREFPSGQLTGEREAIRVDALCRLGRADEARAAAARAPGARTDEALRRCGGR